MALFGNNLNGEDRKMKLSYFCDGKEDHCNKKTRSSHAPLITAKNVSMFMVMLFLALPLFGCGGGGGSTGGGWGVVPEIENHNQKNAILRKIKSSPDNFLLKTAYFVRLL